jgi:hypothetical protein
LVFNDDVSNKKPDKISSNDFKEIEITAKVGNTTDYVSDKGETSPTYKANNLSLLTNESESPEKSPELIGKSIKTSDLFSSAKDDDEVSSVGQDENNSYQSKSSRDASWVSHKSGIEQKVYQEIIKQQKENKQSVFRILKPAEILHGGTYCRRDLFRRCKFATDFLTPKMATEVLDHMKITNEDDRAFKIVAICGLIKSNINARRNYAIKQIRAEMRSKYICCFVFPLIKKTYFILFITKLIFLIFRKIC